MTAEIERLPGTDLLGWTYNVFGALTQPTSRLKCVVPTMAAFETAAYDPAVHARTVIEGVEYYYPKICSHLDVDQSSPRLDYSSVSTDIQFSLAASLNIKAKRGAFSGSLSAKYSKEVSRQSETHYLLITDNFNYGHAELPNLTQSSFDATFWTDLNNDAVSAETLFKKYGTHFVTGLVIGGQYLASFYAAKSSSYSATTFEADASLKYSNMVGSIRVGGSMDLSTSTTVNKVNVSGSISITGGDVSKTKWADWSPTVAADPKPVMFTENGLVPVWTYCTSSTRASYLSAQFDDLYRLVTSGTAIRDYAPSSDRSTSSGVYTWSVDADFKETLKAGDSKDALVVTGFGTLINNDRHVVRIGIQVTDINSGNVYYCAKGDVSKFDLSDYEIFDTVPTGTVMTGLAVREKDCNLNNLGLHYQTLSFIDYGNSNQDTHLGATVNTRYKDRSGNTGAYTGFEQDYKPANPSEGYVLTGIEICCSSKAGGFVTLNVMQKKLARNIDV
jgi:hypothetical protein